MTCVPLEAYSQCFYLNGTQHTVEHVLLPPATCTQKSLSGRDHKGCFSTLPLKSSTICKMDSSVLTLDSRPYKIRSLPILMDHTAPSTPTSHLPSNTKHKTASASAFAPVSPLLGHRPLDTQIACSLISLSLLKCHLLGKASPDLAKIACCHFLTPHSAYMSLKPWSLSDVKV